ncbi:hypothetical protein B0H19DRAFT_1146068 [Mycena capillaripes]|nr:hypothetical protein B0H19DRAFT_1146068 [Mycena capillaripes]
MLGRPPAILALHINRSVHTGFRVAKNTARVAFPELLDLAPYTTGGVLNLDPTTALSGTLDPSAGVFPPVGGEGSGRQGQEECLYRLAAAVCHFGQHSFGHYICYRRAPVPSSSVSSPSSAPSFSPPTGAGAGAYVPAPPAREGSSGTGTGWLRISDARVDRCGVEEVLAEGSAVFMLYYERVPPLGPSPPTPAATPSPLPTLAQHPDSEVYAGDSAETITPAKVRAPAPAVGLATSMGGSGIWGTGMGAGMGVDGALARARVVRSVSLGLGVGSRASVSSSSLSSSSLSLRSVSSVSSSPTPAPAPTTPRARAADVDEGVDDGAHAEVVEALTLVPAGEEDDLAERGGEDLDASALPTPPPTPRAGSETPSPVASPKAKKKKKKKGKGDGQA